MLRYVNFLRREKQFGWMATSTEQNHRGIMATVDGQVTSAAKISKFCAENNITSISSLPRTLMDGYGTFPWTTTERFPLGSR